MTRSPRLDTILMVEKAIQKHDSYLKKKQLWLKLPKKMMYQTYSTIIQYLVISRKISIDAEGKIGWIYYPDVLKKRKGREWR